MGRIPPLDPAPSDGVITLRAWRESDVPAMTAACRDGDIQRWTLVPDDYTEDLASAFVAYAAASREAGTSLQLAAVDASHHDFAHLGLARLHLMPFAANAPSHRVAERAGYTREGVLRSFYKSKSGLVDVVMYSMLRDDPR